MLNVLTAVSGSTGLLFVVANVLAGQTGLPLPAVPTLIIAGALAANHCGWGAEVFVGATPACLLADSGWYLFGRKCGGRFMSLFPSAFATRQLREGGSRPPLVRWCTKTFLVAKCIPGLAIFTSPLAGVSRMSFLPFLLLSAAGAALWVGACLIAGVVFHQQIDALLPLIIRYGGWGSCVVAVLLTGYMAVTWIERRRLCRSKSAPTEMMRR
jgi:membrane protein DedA with SNARE-associated domain